MKEEALTSKVSHLQKQSPSVIKVSDMAIHSMPLKSAHAC